MTTRNQPDTFHPALGGLDNVSDASALDPNMLTRADNIEYLEGGQRKKRLGTTPYNSVAMISTAGSRIRAVSDFWRYGASLTPAQNFLAVTRSSIFVSTGNGAFAALTATSSFGAIGNTTTNITIAGDYAVISDGATAPVTYDQTTLTSTTLGTIPVFEGSRWHLRRLFYYGLSSSPSLVGFTAAGLNGVNFDSTGTDSGTLPIAEGDGDRIIGISKPFHRRLYFFKGPQHGSVHELAGETPSGFTLNNVAIGAPCVNHRAIVTTGNDIYWLSKYGVHSMLATANYGDTEQAFLSLPIQNTFRNDLAINQLSQTWGFWHPLRNIVGWFVVPAGNSGPPLWALVYNYALSDPTPGGKKFWSIWKFDAFNIHSGAVMLTPSGAASGVLMPRLYLGGNGGVLYAGDQATLADNDTAGYSADVRTPTLTRLAETDETREKSFAGVVTYFVPTGSYSANLLVTVDNRQQSYTFDLSGGGATFDSASALWDSSVFGGTGLAFSETLISERGRAITLEWTQTGASQDLQLLGYSVRATPAEAQPTDP